MLSSKIKKGFTLVELMIVIAIIGILAAALFPALTSYLSRGRDTKKIAEIKQLNTALIVYKIDTGGHYVP
jgi:prepilin-type N-terminal cleavage/methylation domain-containing protein